MDIQEPSTSSGYYSSWPKHLLQQTVIEIINDSDSEDNEIHGIEFLRILLF
jgi:hypothetical protein